ncbi:phosphodiester glycosidase family protein [Mobilicoccus pelagius]|uniref:Phosphodiester glycosidase domain-containing protein n=1 Tax=Mobilicoccus pelagius NBRC 104925 TaxID=1089455 RepID=H5USK2_9MICO|nr:phosphodiester glycosidase family protein [Mobilicoccus pelagius]GAB48710.1 hypothetical protein MOPEL_078_00990 [Mobilicoccus pelagius NBRC 104925]
MTRPSSIHRAGSSVGAADTVVSGTAGPDATARRTRGGRRPTGAACLAAAVASLVAAPAVLAPVSATAVGAGTATGAASTQRTAVRAAPRLDVGERGLKETRRVTRLAPGVTLTSIVRGDKPATNGTRGTTQKGPWRVQVAMISPSAKGQLRTAIGTDIARTEGVSTLGRWSGALVAVNGSFFSQGRRTAPGDMVGLAVNGGTVVSEPQRVAGHTPVLMDSRTKALRMDDMTWTATLASDAGRVRLDAVDTPLAVPAGCENVDPARCPTPGRTVRFTPHYSLRTPSGPGAEVVLGRDGCVVSARSGRGTRITAAQVSYQATGTKAAEMLRVAGTGCPTFAESLTTKDGRPVPLTSTTYGVVGRYRLVRDGRIVTFPYTTGFFARQPRTFIGRTAGGSVALVTIDGRSTRSVGATLAEEARIAASLGLVDAVNLDGGGSTAMAVRGRLVNTPAGGRERSVGDAVVFMP